MRDVLHSISLVGIAFGACWLGIEVFNDVRRRFRCWRVAQEQKACDAAYEASRKR